MAFNVPRLVIAGTHSGVGKTTITLAIMAALSQRGQVVQSFKVGPDYLDPLQHKQITGRNVRNLDGWMMTQDDVIESFSKASVGADIAIIEGMMGLFDGKETWSEEGSSAQIAKWLSAPVVLVVNANGMARSLEALLQGFKGFDSALALSGVLFNRTGGKPHLQWLRNISQQTLQSFGGLPKDSGITLPERDLGLVSPVSRDTPKETLDRLAEIAEQYIDLDYLVYLAQSASPLDIKRKVTVCKSKICRIGIARDEAFHFYYQDNFDLLENAGAELIFFSPIHNDKLPEGVAGLYLGGGYPEIYARELSKNRSMVESILSFGEAAGPIYAECGGMIYLSRQLNLSSGEVHKMVGVIPGTIQMQERLSEIGYVEVEGSDGNSFLKFGEKARGHRFHYSSWKDKPVEDENLKCAYRVGERGKEVEGYLSRNVLASYIHLHFASNPKMVSSFIELCTRWKKLESA